MGVQLSRDVCDLDVIKAKKVYRDSSIGIATELPAGRSGDRIPLEARFSAPVQTGPGAHPASSTMGTGSFLEVKTGRSVMLTPHLLLVPWS